MTQLSDTLILRVMNLKEFCSEDRGAQTRLAKFVGVQPQLMHQWVNGKRPIPATRCPSIEKATNGIVRCEDLRPDVDWSFIRGTTKD